MSEGTASPSSESAEKLRVAGRVGAARGALWLTWLAIAALVGFRYLRWEVEYFSSPGPIFQVVLYIALPVFVAALMFYLRVRGNRLWRLEPAAIASGCVLLLVLYQPVATVIVAALLAACFGAGSRLAALLRVGFSSPLDRVTWSIGLGVAALIPTLFLLGLARLYYAPVFLVLLAAPIALFRRDIIAGGALIRDCVRVPPDFAHPFAGIASVFGAVSAALAVAVCLAPSTAFDPLAMHLALAREFSSQHGLYILPSLDYSYFPQGGETIMALAWSLGGQPAAQLISPVFFVLSLIVLFLLGRACGMGRVAAFVGVVSAAALPFVHWTGANAKNDSVMVFFQAAALLAFVRWLETHSRAWIFVGALFLGSSFSIKHVALFGAIPLVCFFLYACRAVRLASVFLVLLCVSALYWHVRTAYLTGNPVFPAQFRETLRAGRANSQSRIAAVAARFWRIPFDAQFNGERAFESPLPNPVGIVLLVFLPMCVLVRGPRTPARRACLLLCAVYFAYWIPTIGIVRYAILPISLLVLILVGKAVDFYDAAPGRVLRSSVAVAVAGTFLFAALGIAIIELNAPMLSLFAKRIDTGQYLDAALRTHRSLAWLAASRPGEKAFGFQNCSRAYSADPAKFYCSMENWDQASAVLDRCRCNYAILPEGRNPTNGGKPLYHDRFFTVWQLN